MINNFTIDITSINKKKRIKLREGLPECIAACDRLLNNLNTLSK